MKVMLVNGSPHEHGCTDAALREVERAARRALSAATFLPTDDVDVTHL